MGGGLRELKAFTTLKLDFGECKQLTSLEGLGDLGYLQASTKLDLNLRNASS